MKKQTDEIEELEEIEDLRDSYPIEEKLFNRTVSQMSEQFCRPSRRRL